MALVVRWTGGVDQCRAPCASLTATITTLFTHAPEHTPSHTTPAGDKDRNRALEGDLVAVEILPRDAWRARTAGGRGRGGQSGSASAAASDADADHEDDDGEGEDEDGGTDLAAQLSRVSLAAGAAADAPRPVRQLAPPSGPGVSPDHEAALPADEAAALTQALYAPRYATDASATTTEGAAATTTAVSAGAPYSSMYPPWLGTAMRSEEYVGSVRGYAMLAALPPGGGGEGSASATGGSGGSQPRGRVVCIMRQTHSRTVIGLLRPSDEKAPLDAPVPDRHAFVRLCPVDQRIPWVMIPRNEAPASFLEAPSTGARTLFAGRISRWGATARFPLGFLLSSIGEAGEIAAETEALLRQAGVRDAPFSEAVMACLAPFEAQLVPVTQPAVLPAAPPLEPALGASVAATAGSSHHGMSAGEASAEAAIEAATGAIPTIIPTVGAAAPAIQKKAWAIPRDELEARRDLRGHRIFTCDPWNAKDLDDALHVTPLGPDPSDPTGELCSPSAGLRSPRAG